METRANHVLIGAFALAGFLGLLLFLMIFARVEFDRQTALYDIRFQSVSGLGRASSVRFEGLPVGQVLDVRLAPEGDGTILVRIEVTPETPVRADSIATIGMQGVTGVSYVGITAGSPDQPRLLGTADVPVIESGRSAFQSLTEDAPQLLSAALDALESVSALLDADNRARVARILDNLDAASGDLTGALTDFRDVSRRVAGAAEDIAAFTPRLEPVADAAVTTLAQIDTTMAAYAGLATRLETTLDTGDTTLEAMRTTFATADAWLQDDLPRLSEDIGATSRELRLATATLSEAAGQTLTGLDATFDRYGLLADRLEQTLDEGDRTLAEATRAFASADAFINTDLPALTGDLTATSTRLRTEAETLGSAATATLARADTALERFAALAPRIERTLDDSDLTLAELRAALDTATAFVDGDLAEMTGDLTATSAAARLQIETLGPQAQGLIAEYTALGAEGRARLEQLGPILTNVDAAIERTVETLDSMERAADNFDDLMENEGAALIAETREMIDGANRAVAIVTDFAESDLPAIVADLRSATTTVRAVVETVGADISAASGRLEPVLADAQTALAQVTGTFANANTTLDAINDALDIGTRTLAAAERAFDGADRVINEEIGTITADLRATLARLDRAIEVVAEDIPGVTTELRTAARSANAAIGEVAEIIATASGPLRSFATQGLPQFTQLGRETRSAVSNLERLIIAIERDPIRFFRGQQTSEFRR